MGFPGLSIGESGSGKTYSVKNFDPESVGIFAVEKSRLPFPNSQRFKVAKRATYKTIAEVLKEPGLKRYVIDDSQYLLVNEMFDKVNEAGYKKFTDMALHFRNLIHTINHQLPDDVFVYFLHHPDTDATTGRIKAKTIGKMLDEKLTVEGCFDVVLFAQIEAGEHYFITQSDGTTSAKSPEGCFDLKIPNDLDFVDRRLREYYGLEAV